MFVTSLDTIVNEVCYADHSLPDAPITSSGSYKVNFVIGNETQALLFDVISDLKVRGKKKKPALSIIQGFIDELPEEQNVTLLKPIPYQIVNGPYGGNDYIASFEKGQVYISGETPEEALDELKHYICGDFAGLEGYSFERLGSNLQKKLLVLKEYMKLN